MFLAYGGLVSLAILPIYTGAYASLRRPESAPPALPDEEPDDLLTTEGLRSSDALIFPLLAGCVLGGLYLLITYISKEWVNTLITLYMLCVGLVSVTHAMARSITTLYPASKDWPKYSITTADGDIASQFSWYPRLSTLYLLAGFLSLLISLKYVKDKNWIAANIFGLSFAFNGIQLLALDSFRTGMILLGGLFLYDIYFVFGTNIMLAVAQGIEAPIKIVFPRDIIHDFYGPASMLGLGDIVIPGVYCALSLRYDLYSFHRKHPRVAYKKHETYFQRPYFHTSMLAYLLGLVMTIIALHLTKSAQPALLYLSPSCIISTIALAWYRDELSDMWIYKEAPSSELASESKVA